ncbi:MAG: DUF2007 domain-containing protein [Verrucomicrobiota bacterium]
MKTIAQFGSLDEAQALKLKLGSVGIEAFIPDEMSAGIAPHLFINRVGIRVQVAEKDEAEAREVMEGEVTEVGEEEED